MFVILTKKMFIGQISQLANAIHLWDIHEMTSVVWWFPSSCNSSIIPKKLQKKRKHGPIPIIILKYGCFHQIFPIYTENTLH